MTEAPPHLLLFKTAEQERQYLDPRLSPLLAGIVNAAVRFAFLSFRWAFVITEVWRSHEADRKLGGSGVHPAWRAVDVRTHDIPVAHVEAVAKWVNAQWVYDPLRPWMKVAYHKPHGTGPHIHFQVHHSTRTR